MIKVHLNVTRVVTYLMIDYDMEKKTRVHSGDVLTAQSEVLRKLFSDLDITQHVRPPAQKNPSKTFVTANFIHNENQ